MKAFTLLLFVSTAAASGFGEAAQGLDLEAPAENLHLRGTNTWVSVRGARLEPTFDGILDLQEATVGPRLSRSFDGDLNLQRAGGRVAIYRGQLTIVEEVGNETRKVKTWMELHLRNRRERWIGHVHSGFFGGSRLIATVDLAEGSGIEQLVFRGPIQVVECDSGDLECSKYSNGEIEFTLTARE